MIVKAINQDEFRDFSFVNTDWQPRECRLDSASTTLTTDSSSTLLSTSPPTTSTSFNSTGNNMTIISSSSSSSSSQPGVSAAAASVIGSGQRAASPQLLVSQLSTAPISTPTSSGGVSISCNISQSPRSNSPAASAPPPPPPPTKERVIQNTDI